LQTQQQTSSLENIYSDSFPANHLLQISVVRQVSDENYKKQYFCFLSLIPGEQSQTGGRTFNFQNRINLKVDSHKIAALGYAVKYYAEGKESIIGPFSIFVDSSKSQYGGNMSKSVGLQRTVNPKQNNAPVIVLYFKSGTNSALAFSMSPADALAFGDRCLSISDLCEKLELARSQAASFAGTYPNPNVGTPPTNPPTKQQKKYGNTPGQVVNNFSNSFDELTRNFESPPGVMFDDNPF